jgi:hypothetical protein
MDTKAILGTLTAIFLMSILFFPQGSNFGGVLILGIFFGALWFFSK